MAERLDPMALYAEFTELLVSMSEVTVDQINQFREEKLTEDLKVKFDTKLDDQARQLVIILFRMDDDGRTKFYRNINMFGFLNPKTQVGGIKYDPGERAGMLPDRVPGLHKIHDVIQILEALGVTVK